MPKQRGDGPVSHANAMRPSILGIRVQGDLGPFTTYTDRYGRVKYFLYSPPTKPPTPAQLAQRERFRNAQAIWRSLTTQEKDNLEAATNAANICMTGQNLYMSACLQHANDSLQVVARQTGIPLPNAPPL